ncbi:MAG: efflux RND transporter permease subunit [Acidobacteria bacterium]|nr:efflux RND transporter permease subunit [Acidobacteriota bacterium]
MNPVKGSLRYPVVTLVLAAMTAGVGVHALLRMPRTEDPSITIRQGLVLAWYPGATSVQVEQQVTRRLEERILRFEEVRKEKTYSTTRPGLAVVMVELEESVKDAPAFWAKLRHAMNEAAAMELPRGVLGPLVNSEFGDTVAMLLAVHGKRYGYRELHDYTDRIEDELRTVRGLGKLAAYGEQSEEIRVTSSLERLSQYFADPLRVIQALQQRNVITSSGAVEAETAKVPLRTTGLFTTEDQIRNVLVDVSRTGQPVYIRDFAQVERVYQDPAFVVRYDGEPAVLLSVEMQRGKNIVEFGGEITAVLERLKTVLPPDVEVDVVTNQAAVVADRMKRLGEEFLLAIGAVILVTVILLPLRVAVIAAVAIPVTILTSLGLLHALGVELHQVSIAALIVVLGIVVDDAIVIADNYVDCLDRGVSREEAAWRSVSEVIVPVLVATLTIIASFLPLLVLHGSVGEFIHALPVTVAVALSVSFVVAILLTPLLCRFFIRRGLHAEGASGGMLGRLQGWYGSAMRMFLRRKLLGVGLGVAAVASGVSLYLWLPEQFFPSAERNQFVMDVWMPQGSRIEATDGVMRRVEGELRAEKGVAHYASFLGQSAPRFYYNVNPQLPDTAYGQLLVNTMSEKETPALVARLRGRLARVVPEALIVVKELQQGMVMEAPVEVRIAGYDIGELQRIGKAVEGIVRDVGFAEMVQNDYFNDSMFVDVDVDTEVSNRLGLSNAIVSQTLAGALSGAPVSTFWEGNRAVNIVLRLDAAYRQSFDDVRNAYLTSPVTQARVPLRSVAKLEPEWQTSRIVRRNGVRTLTVRAFAGGGHYATELLDAITPRIARMTLPAGYSVAYGGEQTNTEETMPGMIVALMVSLVAIFLVLLMQFRTLSDPLIVMASIPLTLFGAALGLVLTGYPFGFTAFTGVISLSGIVVRNSIILVDYIREKLRDGRDLEQAAREAGERRLRPIFLTTMAAAVGVTPMIASGSSLWGPLASVIAVGLISSMFFTLVVVPVLYVLVKGSRGAVAGGVLLVLLCGRMDAASRELTLDEAVGLALRQNHALQIARARVEEKKQKRMGARGDLYPRVTTDSLISGLSNNQLVTVPAGSLGVVPGLGPFPTGTMTFDQGSRMLTLGNTTLGMPLTQLWKIREGVKVASAEERVSVAELKKAEDEVVLGVTQLYFGLVAARAEIVACEAQIAAGEEALREAREAVRSGNALDVVVLGARAAVLKARQSLLAVRNQAADWNAELDSAMGLGLDTELVVVDAVADVSLGDRGAYLRTALEGNAELRAARAMAEQALRGATAAGYESVPNISVFARHTYQNGVPFLAHSFGTFGLQMSWDLWDGGKRKALRGERAALLRQARENVRRVEDRVSVDVEKAWRKVESAKMMVDVAREALELRREAERISGDQFRVGVISGAKKAEAVAARRSAEADELKARVAWRVAVAEMERVAGGTH